MKTTVLVVGGGLCGLHTAVGLHRRGVDVVLLEARRRLGGRILSRPWRDADDADGPAFDMGPTWFWPHQRHMLALVRSLQLDGDVFEQYSDGDALWQQVNGHVFRGATGISMRGSLRLVGGVGRIVDALSAQLPGDAVIDGARLTELRLTDGRPAERSLAGQRLVSRAMRGGDALAIESDYVVLALPPRLAMSSVTFAPALSASRAAELMALPTWMAAQAKLVALYDKPFWRSAGLSGDALSLRGPLREIHDASPRSGGPYALFGFIGTSPDIRAGRTDELKEAALMQLASLFGAEASAPLAVYLKDWAGDPLTCTEQDRSELSRHITEPLAQPIEQAWGERLIWSGSETAGGGERNSGYLEGALEASDRTLAFLSRATEPAPPSR